MGTIKKVLLFAVKKVLLRILLILVSATAVFVVFYHFYSRSGMPSGREYPVEIRDGVKHFSQGYLEYRLGIPFLHARGVAYEVGLQYGVLLKEEMGAVFRNLLQIKREMLERLAKNKPWYQRLAMRLIAPIFLEFRIRSFRSRLPQEYLSQLKGMAEGSKIPLKDLLAGVFFEDLACSQFIVKRGGRFLQGRNADYPMPFLGEHPLVSHISKTGKYSYIDVGVVGLPYVISGVNEKGLTLSWSGANETKFIGKGTTLFFNRILEECRDLSQVEGIGKNVDRFITFVGSSEEKEGVVYEIVGGRLCRNDMKEDYVFAANRCVSDEMAKRFNTIEDWNWSNRGRLDKYRELMSGQEEWDVDAAIALLSNTDFYHYREVVPARGEADTINHDQTMLSTVLDPQNGTVYFAVHPHYAAWSRWIRFQYQTGEVSVYKAEDERLKNPQVRKFLELKKKFHSINRNDPSVRDGLILELEQSNLNNAWALDWLWALNFEKNDWPRAEGYADRLMEKYPDLGLGYSRKARIMTSRARNEEAVAYYQKALAAPLVNEYEKAFWFESLAWLYEKIGNRGQALEYARESLEKFGRFGKPPGMEKRIRELEKLIHSGTASK